MNVLETMKQALDDLQSVLCNPDGEVVAIPPPDCFIAQDAIFAVREAIEQMEKQEPVAWMHDDPKRYDVIHHDVKALLQKQNASYLHRPIDKTEHYTIPLYSLEQIK